MRAWGEIRCFWNGCGQPVDIDLTTDQADRPVFMARFSFLHEKRSILETRMLTVAASLIRFFNTNLATSTSRNTMPLQSVACVTSSLLRLAHLTCS